MKIMIIYDTVFNNTEKVARAIGNALGSRGDIKIIQVTKAEIDHLTDVEWLILGSPTRGFNATDNMKKFLQKIPVNKLSGIKSAAFDTRIDLQDIKSPFFRFIVGHAGYAADKMARMLIKKGAEVILPPGAFLVKGAEGPLKEGELEKAAAWANSIN